jgi:3-oxoacyl-[acyl-carrier-protein] synthase II
MVRERRVMVTGIGLLCPLGDSPRVLHEALCRGGGSPLLAGPLAPAAPEPHLAGRNVYPLDRPARLLAAAAELALTEGSWTREELQGHEMGLFVGTMFSSARTIARFDCQAVREGPAYASPLDFANTVINAPAGQVAIWHGLRGTNQTIATGVSSGLEAIGCAADAIRVGRADCLLAGGVEELSPELTHAFAGAGLLCGGDELPRPFDPSSRGLALSEGVALLVLEEAEFARRRGARALAEVRGHGQAFDASRRGDVRHSVGAISRTMGTAIEQACLSPGDIDVICVSANGTTDVDLQEALAIAAVFEGAIDRPTISGIKALLGEPLGAGGPLQCAAMIEALCRGIIPSAFQLRDSRDGVAPRVAPAPHPQSNLRTCLINSLSLDGHSCSLVLASAAT